MVTALLAKDFLSRRQNKGATVVYDLRSSHVVPDEITAAGGVPKRDRVGHAFIKKTMADTKAVLRRELSGHIYFRDFFFADSAAIAFARDAVGFAQRPAQAAERGSCSRSTSTARAARSISRSKTRTAKSASSPTPTRKGKVDYLDGITVDLGDWWFNVRKSNTEPLLRLNLETPSPETLHQTK